MSKTKLPSVKDIPDLDGRYVLVRTSLNVPIDNDLILHHFRLLRGIATINYLVQQNARVIVCGHIGSNGDQSTDILRSFYAQHVPVVRWIDEVVGSEVKNLRDELKPGEVLLLENLRKDPREKKNDRDFARDLAGLAEIYVNDAFAASHREHASIVSVPEFLPAYAGLNFLHEIDALAAARQPASPSLFMLGGAKFSTKLPLVEALLAVYDHIFIGGAIANDFFKAKGYEVGTSLLSDIDLSDSPLLTNKKILLPSDVIVSDGQRSRVALPDTVESHEKIMDIGPDSIAQLEPLVVNAGSILWNGPFGNYEHGFAEQTIAMATLLRDVTGSTTIGGGDTVAAIESVGCQDQVSFVSTAGGAMLTYLETGTLPGITALRKSTV